MSFSCSCNPIRCTFRPSLLLRLITSSLRIVFSFYVLIGSYPLEHYLSFELNYLLSQESHSMFFLFYLDFCRSFLFLCLFYLYFELLYIGLTWSSSGYILTISPHILSLLFYRSFLHQVAYLFVVLVIIILIFKVSGFIVGRLCFANRRNASFFH